VPATTLQLASIALLAAALPACATRPPRPVAASAPPPHVTEVRVRVQERPGVMRVRRVPLEEYVAGCVDAELGRIDLDQPAAARMRRIQAILCRTYAVANLGRHAAEGFDLCATDHCQMFRQLPSASLSARLARDGASGTAGLIIAAAGRPINALFHSNCGGRTSRAESVWGGRPEPYLVSQIDPPCERAPLWRIEADRNRLLLALRRDQRTDPGSRLDEVRIAARDEAGRAATVVLAGATVRSVRGDTFRSALTSSLGATSLRSTMFVVRQNGDTFIFEGKGSGHGVGLCQAGAVARARTGQTEEAILSFYYPGTQLLRMTTSR